MISDFFDFSIYIDADEADSKCGTSSAFSFYSAPHFKSRLPISITTVISQCRGREVANGLWREINLVNLRENILPTAHACGCCAA